MPSESYLGECNKLYEEYEKYVNHLKTFLKDHMPGTVTHFTFTDSTVTVYTLERCRGYDFDEVYVIPFSHFKDEETFHKNLSRNRI